jgi:hypothetical protein
MPSRNGATGAIKEPMTKIILALVVAMLPAWVAAAERQPPAKPSDPLRPVSSNPCAAYGAGYVKVEGSSTCVKIGGSVRVQVGGSAPR